MCVNGQCQGQKVKNFIQTENIWHMKYTSQIWKLGLHSIVQQLHQLWAIVKVFNNVGQILDCDLDLWTLKA